MRHYEKLLDVFNFVVCEAFIWSYSKFLFETFEVFRFEGIAVSTCHLVVPVLRDVSNPNLRDKKFSLVTFR